MAAMKRLILAAVAACSSPSSPRLPGGSITPHLEGNPANSACGDDVAYDGDTTPDVRYRYAFDGLGRVSHETGTDATGTPDSIDYTWDHLDHMTHMVQTRAAYETRYEIVEDFDALGDLVDYSWHASDPLASYDEMQEYAYAQFDGNGNPAHEVATLTGQPAIGVELVYDALGRIARSVQDNGSTTTYTYDDAATRTVTIDTDGGASHGVIVYDDQSREQSEAWDGTGAGVIASATQYDWNGGQLLGATFQQGSTDAPHTLVTYQVDTLVYDCTRSTIVVPDSARRGSNVHDELLEDRSRLVARGRWLHLVAGSGREAAERAVHAAPR
jgi:YD repeat-containing protein